VKFLFDHNLSPCLVSRLADLYPHTNHTSLSGLDRATDSGVWAYARVHGYVIVTKDIDFSDVSVLRGFPPKVIWIRLGNCTTSDLENALRRSYAAIVEFINDPTVGVLEIR
jgi:predicted nuclease of predicted toxin-antitoxin system